MIWSHVAEGADSITVEPHAGRDQGEVMRAALALSTERGKPVLLVAGWGPPVKIDARSPWRSR